MTNDERRMAEMRSIMKIAPIEQPKPKEEPKEEPKKQAKKQAKKAEE